MQKLGFSIFSVLSLNIENYFLVFQSTIKIGVSAIFCVFCCWKRRKQAKNDNWNLWILVFSVQKWPFRDAHLLSKKRAWNPYFHSVFRVRAFWAKLTKKGNFGHPKKKTIFTDNWKAHFWVFLVFSCFFSFFLFLFFLFCFVFLFGGFKGHVRWPEGPPHLALNPPTCFFWLLSFLCFS